MRASGCDPLPFEQKAHVVARRDWLDFRAQALDRVAVNASKQATLAPFLCGRPWRETTREREAFVFKGSESRQDLFGFEPERGREFSWG